MRKFLSLPILFLCCTFFFVPKIHAATHNITFTPSAYDLLLNSNFTDMIQDVSSANFYVVAYDTSGYFYSKINLNSIADYSCTWNLSKMLCSNSRRNFKQYFDSSTFVNTTSATSEITNYHFNTSNGIIYYTNIPLIVNNGDTYNISDGTNSWSCTGTSSNPCSIPDLLTFYNMYHTPITPDNYPLLTSFYSLIIEKLSMASEFFVSNYIYLSIFAIFCIIAIIELIKRRFSK